MRPIQILMYHQVGQFGRIKAHRASYCDVGQFALQMGWLARMGYSVLGLDQVAQALQGKFEVPPRAVCLTFDDGYDNFRSHAWPILRRHGFPACVYVLTGMLGQRADWYAEEGQETPTLLSAQALRELAEEGLTVGLHGQSHQRLAECSTEQVHSETHLAKQALEALLQRPVHHFCYPYGSLNATVVRQVQEAGFATASTCFRMPLRQGAHPMLLPRKAISLGDNLLGFVMKLHWKNTASINTARHLAQTLAELGTTHEGKVG